MLIKKIGQIRAAQAKIVWLGCSWWTHEFICTQLGRSFVRCQLVSRADGSKAWQSRQSLAKSGKVWQSLAIASDIRVWTLPATRKMDESMLDMLSSRNLRSGNSAFYSKVDKYISRDAWLYIWLITLRTLQPIRDTRIVYIAPDPVGKSSLILLEVVWLGVLKLWRLRSQACPMAKLLLTARCTKPPRVFCKLVFVQQYDISKQQHGLARWKRDRETEMPEPSKSLGLPLCK